jgi:hypothetical protein
MHSKDSNTGRPTLYISTSSAPIAQTVQMTSSAPIAAPIPVLSSPLSPFLLPAPLEVERAASPKGFVITVSPASPPPMQGFSISVTAPEHNVSASSSAGPSSEPLFSFDHGPASAVRKHRLPDSVREVLRSLEARYHPKPSSHPGATYRDRRVYSDSDISVRNKLLIPVPEDVAFVSESTKDGSHTAPITKRYESEHAPGLMLRRILSDGAKDKGVDR